MVDGEDGDPAASSEPVVEAEPETPSLTMEEFLAQRAGIYGVFLYICTTDLSIIYYIHTRLTHPHPIKTNIV